MTIQEKAIEQLERVSKHLATIGEKEDYTDVAIQALEQECEDAVSRKAALDKKWDVPYDGKYIQVVDVGDIKELPSVTPKKDGWTPCSERLPEYGEVVMCSCTNNGITISCITHKGVKPSKSVRFGQHSVIAWMPLPEPYKEESEG